MEKNKEDIDLVIYNDEQKFFVEIVDNAEATTEHLEKSLKLQRWIKEKAEEEVIRLSD